MINLNKHKPEAVFGLQGDIANEMRRNHHLIDSEMRKKIQIILWVEILNKSKNFIGE